MLKICLLLGVMQMAPTETQALTVLDSLLKADFASLQRQQAMPLADADTFRGYFRKGISACRRSFFRNDQSSKLKQRRQYRKRIKLVQKALQHKTNWHQTFPPGPPIRPQRDMRKWSASGDYLFSHFSGRWHGKWRDELVDHLWLPPHKQLNIPLGDQTHLIAFQSVYTGDGIAWNYLLKTGNRHLIIGFACHTDKSGKVYMERPHVGIPEGDDWIVWLTIDHVYLEFICASPACILKVRHYVISGIYFPDNSQARDEPFQAIYTIDPAIRPNWKNH